MVDANGNADPNDDGNVGRRLTYGDARGNIVAIREFNQIGNSTTLSPLTTRYTYDRLDQLLNVVDAVGNTTTAEYDSVGRMVTLTSPDAGRTEYRFDLNGNLGAKETPVLRAQNKLIKYEYDFNRLRKVDYPSMTDTTYTYGGPGEGGDTNGNRAGRIKQVTSEGATEQRWYDRLGNTNKTITTLPNLSQSSPATMSFTMQFSYDWMGRMLDMTFPNWLNSDNVTFVPGAGEKVSYVYDRGGNLTKITGHQQTVNPQHPCDSNTPCDFTYLQEIRYNAWGLRGKVVSGNGIPTDYSYDALNQRLTDIRADSLGPLEVQQGRTPTPFVRLHYTYDAVGNIKSLQNQASLQPWMNASVCVGPIDMSYTYDNLYQLKTLSGKYRRRVGEGMQYSDSFTYDAVGNFQKKAQSQDRLVWDNQNVTPTYNPSVAMTQLDGSRFDHNVQNLTYTLDYTYGGPRPHGASRINETLPGSTTPFPRDVGYDADGNNTGNAFRGTTRTHEWDEADRLKEVKASTQSVAKFLYDDQGERTKKKTNAGDAWYVNQFYSLLSNGRPTKNIFAGETRIATKTDAIWMQKPVLHFYHPDHLGTTSYISDAEQRLVQHEMYFAYGDLWRGGEQPETDLPAESRREYLFTSKEWDVDTSLYYFGARYFDPHASAWQSSDPILSDYMRGEPNGGVRRTSNLALYSYSWNNPVGVRDPDGRCPNCAGDFLAAHAGDSPLAAKQFAAYSAGTAAASAFVLLPAAVSSIAGGVSAAGRAVVGLGTAVVGWFAQRPNVVTSINQLGQGPGVTLPTTSAAQSARAAGGAATRGAPIAGKIEGFTIHGVDQAITRGVKPASILDAVKNPLKVKDVITDSLGRASQRYIGRGAEVVLNPQTGKVISVNPTSSAKAARLLGGE